MNVGTPKRWAAAAALSAAVVVGTASPVFAAPSQDPRAADAASATGTGLVDIAAPQGMTGQALLTAHNAGISIYELAEVKTYSVPKTGYLDRSEYRRVYDSNALGSPTPKFVVLGEFPPDVFFVSNLPGARPILVNRREVHEENRINPAIVFDTTPYNFNKSPLIQLPGGGPSVGLAFVSGTSGS
ncbi:hypothetical protein [Rhodococcus sp. NPDC049939]|uniref:hypothetical protein n=1 Tax=Rhodococcus sp. NPDC049939 TaxID=3155511 RepID=UPI0033E6FE78